MRFQVLVNGSPVCTAGQPGFGVLSALLSWVTLDPAKVPAERSTDPRALPNGQLEFSVGGIDNIDDRHTSWKVPPVAVGDEITIRVLASGQFDAPTVKFG
jgi:hypothetical protein